MKTADVPRSKSQRPETIGEAVTWVTVKGRYLTHGLCHACASQAAWGHQLGWGLINPPCAGCQPIVAAFPSGTLAGSPWRKFPRGGLLATDAPGDDALGAQADEEAG